MTVPKLLSGAVVLSVVVAFVPAALGADRPDDRADRVGAGAAAPAVVVAAVRPDDRADRVGAGAAAPAVVVAAVRPDDRADRVGGGAAAPVAVAAAVRPDDRAVRVGGGAATPVAVETPAVAGGIDWSDPLVIGGLTALIAAAGVAIAYGVMHHRHGGAGKTGGPRRPAVTH